MSLYTPAPFQIADVQVADAVMRDYPFATLISDDGQQTRISHVPILARRLDDGGLHLHFHLARANPQSAQISQGARTTAVFHGQHGYISPTWYQSRDNVPTWNYVAVHVTGPILPRDPGETFDDLVALAAQFETGPDPWIMDDVSTPNRMKLMAALQAFRMEGQVISAKSKLSQNRSALDRQGVITGLRYKGGAGDAALADLMKENTHE